MSLLYRQSSRGHLVPQGWSVVPIGKLFKVTRGKVLSMNLVSSEHTDSMPFAVYSSQTKNKGLAGYYSDYLYEDAITWTTDGANAGDVNYRPGKFYCTNVCGVLLNTDGYANSCVAAILNSVTRSYVSYVGNPKLMNDVMAKIEIPLPSLAEQRKIAEILKTWDEAIETAEAELKLKQDRKRWIMKTLLSSSAEQPGSLSLHGCPKVKLQEICDVEWGNSELTKSSYIQNGKYLAVSAAGCDGRIDHSEHKKNTPVISAIGANCGRMFLPSEDFTAIKNTITITPKESIADGRYLYETLTFLELPKRGGAQPFMSKGDIDNFKIPLPTLQHQKKIADVLRSTEADIEFIKTRIEALQNQKRGLMQKLLTGEIRVAV